MVHQTAIVSRPSSLPDVGLSQEAVARLVDAFLSGRNARTLIAYRQDLNDFRAFLTVKDLSCAAACLIGQGPGIANETALRYKTNLRDRGLSPATINRRLAALRSMVKLGRTLGLVGWTLEISNVKAQAYRDTRGPGREGFSALLITAGKQKPKAIRDRAILHLLFDLALRRAEVVALDVADVDFTKGTISILGKGREQKEILSLPALTAEALRAWLDVHPTKTGPLFVNFDRAAKGQGRLTGAAVYYLVRRYGELAGLKTRPHGLRHAGITEAVKLAQAHGYGLEEVLDFSRHTDVKTLMIYRDRERNAQGRLAELVAAGG